jgi:flagellar biosynthetic protein FlhB
MAEDASQRTEEPSPKRREEARADGRVPQSVEVTSVSVLLTALLITSRQGPAMLSGLREMMRRNLLGLSNSDLTPAQVIDIGRHLVIDTFAIVAPILGATALVALAANFAQTGFMFVPKRVLPDAKKISPNTQLERIFSKRGAAELLKAIIKIGLVGWITWKLIRALQPQLVPLALQGPREILELAGSGLKRTMGWTAGMLSVFAILDYYWQRRQTELGMRMTRQEVKDERRQAEGDPHIRQRVKRTYQKLAKGRMLADVPTADVVVTNPIHVAVALRYVPGKNTAPMVVAKGTERVAERIKEIARQNGVPIVERRALARALFRSVPIGIEIPSELYRAVAEILAYIYGLQARRAG